MNRRELFGFFLAAPLAALSIRQSQPRTPVGPFPGADGATWPWTSSEYIASHRLIREYLRNPDGSNQLLREYGVMGTTHRHTIGDLITRTRPATTCSR